MNGILSDLSNFNPEWYYNLSQNQYEASKKVIFNRNLINKIIFLPMTYHGKWNWSAFSLSEGHVLAIDVTTYMIIQVHI